jgi:hypothetical protein
MEADVPALVREIPPLQRTLESAYTESDARGVPVVIFVGVQPVKGDWVSVYRSAPFHWRTTHGAIVGTRTEWLGDVERPTWESINALVAPPPVYVVPRSVPYVAPQKPLTLCPT